MRRTTGQKCSKRTGIQNKIRWIKGLIVLLYAFLLSVSEVQAAGLERMAENNAAGQNSVYQAEEEISAEAETSLEEEREAGNEAESGSSAEETKNESENNAGEESGSESESGSGGEGGSESESGSEGETETGSESGTEGETESGSEEETETQIETETVEELIEEQLLLMEEPMAASVNVSSPEDLGNWGISFRKDDEGYHITGVIHKDLLPERLRLPEGVVSIEAGAFANCDTITRVDAVASLRYIHNGAFKGCDNLSYVSVGNRLKEIGNSAFQDCKNLRLLYLNVESLTVLGENCFSSTGEPIILEKLELNVRILSGSYEKSFAGTGIERLHIYNLDPTFPTSSDIPSNAFYETYVKVLKESEHFGWNLDYIKGTDMDNFGRSGAMAWLKYDSGTLEGHVVKDNVLEGMAAEYYATTAGFQSMDDDEVWVLCFREESAISVKLTGVLPAGESGELSYTSFWDFYEKTRGTYSKAAWPAEVNNKNDETFNRILLIAGDVANQIAATERKISEEDVGKESSAEPVHLMENSNITEMVSDSGGENAPVETAQPEPDAETSVSAENENIMIQGETAIPEDGETVQEETKEPAENNPEQEETKTSEEKESEQTATEIPAEEIPEQGSTDMVSEEISMEEKLNLDLNAEVLLEEAGPAEEEAVLTAEVTDPARLGLWGIGYTIAVDGYYITDVFDKSLLPGSLQLPEGVLSIEAGAFADCDTLTQVVAPDSLVYIHDEAFRGCDQLSYVNGGSGLKEIGNRAFQDCKNLKEIYLGESENLTVLGENCFSSTGDQLILVMLELNIRILSGRYENSFAGTGMESLFVYDTESVFSQSSGIPNSALYDPFIKVLKESERFGWDLSYIRNDNLGTMTWVKWDTGNMNGYPVKDMVLAGMAAEYYAATAGYQAMSDSELWACCFGEATKISVDFTGILPAGESGRLSYTSFWDFYRQTRGTDIKAAWPAEVNNKNDETFNRILLIAGDVADQIAATERKISEEDAGKEPSVEPVYLLENSNITERPSGSNGENAPVETAEPDAEASASAENTPIQSEPSIPENGEIKQEEIENAAEISANVTAPNSMEESKTEQQAIEISAEEIPEQGSTDMPAQELPIDNKLNPDLNPEISLEGGQQVEEITLPTDTIQAAQEFRLQEQSQAEAAQPQPEPQPAPEETQQAEAAQPQPEQPAPEEVQQTEAAQPQPTLGIQQDCVQAEGEVSEMYPFIPLAPEDIPMEPVPLHIYIPVCIPA